MSGNNNINIKKFNELIIHNDLTLITEYNYNFNSINNREDNDVVYVNSSFFKKYNDIPVCFVINKNKNLFELVRIKQKNEIIDGEFSLNTIVAKSLDIKERDIVELFKYNVDKCYSPNKIMPQKFEDVQKENITIPKYMEEFFKDKNVYYVLYNLKTNCKIIVQSSHIKCDNNTEAGAIRLNRKQRIQLNCLDDKYSDFIILPNILLKKEGSRKLKKAFLNFYVGKVNVGLISKRTYQTDETFNVVRLTDNNMKLIGVEETDVVNVSYMNNKCLCRVLCINDESKILEQNNEDNSIPIFDLENIIAIPASIRNELGIQNVSGNVSVKVERDMEYIWNKNLSQQVLPIILILFSTEIFVDAKSLIIKILIALISMPITLFFNLSKERSICKI